MGQMEDMTMFLRIVEAGGISKAAEQLGLAKSAVSRRLSDLEKRLDTQLLSRTTRKSSLTAAGNLYYRRAQNILDEVALLNEQASGTKARVEGRLKMSAPLSFGLLHLIPVVGEFARENRDLGFQIDFSDRHIDLVEEGFEMAIRIGNLHDSSYQAKRITPIRHVLCASPAYLEKYTSPAIPSELADHAFLHYGLLNNCNLQLIDRQGKQHIVQISAKIVANNGDFLKEMAIKGHGITYLPTFLAYQELATKELVYLLPDYQLPIMYAYAVYPKNRFLPQRCRLLIDFIVEKFGDTPYWDK